MSLSVPQGSVSGNDGVSNVLDVMHAAGCTLEPQEIDTFLHG